MANVKIRQKDNGIVLQLDDPEVSYNVVEWVVRQSNGEKPQLTFIAPMTIEVDSLTIEKEEEPELVEEPSI